MLNTSVLVVLYLLLCTDTAGISADVLLHVCVEIGSLVHNNVKPITYQIYTCHFLAWCFALIGYGKGWLAQYQKNVTEWDIMAWGQWSDFPVGQHYKVTMNVHCYKSVPILL